MDELKNEQVETSEGNTESRSFIRNGQYHYWCFTLNNYSNEQIEHLEQILRHECHWYIFQEETGEKGTQHLQGQLYLKSRKRMTELKKLDRKISWRPTNSVTGSMAYCKKELTRTGEQYVYGIDVPDKIHVEEPYGWQLNVMEIIKKKPDNRSIHWFWEPIGNIGKTTLCKYLVEKHGATIVSGKGSDMFYNIIKRPRNRKLIIVDLPRRQLEYINYGAIEQIKNGLIFSGKYESCQLVFNCPHVIVFANAPPNREEMSADRWKVHDIRELIQTYEFFEPKKKQRIE